MSIRKKSMGTVQGWRAIYAVYDRTTIQDLIDNENRIP